MIHIGKRIQQKLEEIGETESWLAEQLDCNVSEVLNIFEKESIDTDTLLCISHILKYNFFQDYSECLSRFKSKSS